MSVGTDFICKNEEAFVRDSMYSSTKFINCHLAYSFFSDEEGGKGPLENVLYLQSWNLKFLRIFGRYLCFDSKQVNLFNRLLRKESSVRYKCLADCVQLQLVIWTVSPVLPRKYWDKEWVTLLCCFSSLALNTSQTQESFEVNFMKWNHMMPLYKQNKLS